MGVQALLLGHGLAAARLQTLRQVLLAPSLTQTAPGWQLSGAIVHFWPTALVCWDEQSHTVAASVLLPVSPARNTHLRPLIAELQVAAPTGLQLSMGGEQKKRFFTARSLLSTIELTVQRLFEPQSRSTRQVL